MSERENSLELFLANAEESTEEGFGAESSSSLAHTARSTPSLWLQILGVVGELMICAGTVIGLFVVWQVWWTNIEMSGEQDKLVAQTQEEFEEVDSTVIAQPAQGDPPVPSSELSQSDVIGLLHIPALDGKKTTQIRQGEALSVLNLGVFGHYSSTAMPGEVGNFSLAVHRDSYGSRVLHIDELRVGDAIIVETESTWYVYKFTDSRVVDPTDVYVVSADPYAAAQFPNPNSAQVSPSGRYLTITTCHPPFVSNKRWIVHAELDSWMPRTAGVPKELVQEGHAAVEVDQTGTTIRDAINDAVKELASTKQSETA